MSEAAAGAAEPSPRAVVVFNPAAGGPATAADRARVEEALAAGGFDHEWVETTKDDPGEGITTRAVADGASLILACGGDGTVAACATALAGTEVPLAVLPSGAGNLLAINFDIPLDIGGAIEVAINGRRRRIDLGAAGDRCFAVMAGIGFDAAMLKDTDPALKARIKALAYVPAGLKHLRAAPTEMSLSLDDGPPMKMLASVVLVGNLGRIQGGLEVLPDAEPDDGFLDVAVVRADTVRRWAAVLFRVIRKKRGDDTRVRTYRARHIFIHTEAPLPFELDGDVCGDSCDLEISVRPRAITICVPLGDRRRLGRRAKIDRRRQG